jgi:hypothetical protein
MEKYHQIVKVVLSKDFRFIHIDAGIGENGIQRISTETSEENLVHCLVSPILDRMVRAEFRDLKDVALTFKIEFV